MTKLVTITVSALTFGVAFAATAWAEDDAALIQNAEMAAPAPVGAGATIYATGDNGAMRTLRTGTNGWWCMPDVPTTPGNDPMCGDANAFAWAGAWMGHTDPPAGKVGFIYMLEGGPAGSNSDPYAMTPPAGENWVETASHVMIVNIKGMVTGYPGGAKPDTTMPYVMWAGTPYEHLMMPLK